MKRKLLVALAILIAVGGVTFFVKGTDLQGKIPGAGSLPDLVVTDISVDTTTGIPTITQGNVGLTSVADTTAGSTSIFVDDMAKPTYSYAWSTLYDRGFLIAGASSTMTTDVLKPGVHEIKACIDSSSKVQEKSEKNNCLTETITLSVQGSLLGTYNPSGVVAEVVVSGNYAYLAVHESGLEIIDISNKSTPVLTGAYNTPGDAQAIFLKGDYAYVADTTSGLQIINISNPSSPILTGSYDTPELSTGVYVKGDYAYVADTTSGLQIINISNPSTPVLTGSYNTTGGATDVEVIGDYAYVADLSSGLQIIDISTPSTPSLVGTYYNSGFSYGVTIDGDYAYIANRELGLEIVDISTPSSPILMGNYTSGVTNHTDVYFQDSLAYLTNIASKTGDLEIVDVSETSAPVLVGTYGTGTYSATNVYVDGTYVYIALQNSGLQIVELGF